MTRRVVVRTLAFHAAGPGSIPGLRHHLFRCLAALRVYFSRLYYKASENIDISTAYYKARENINISTGWYSLCSGRFALAHFVLLILF